MHSPIHGGLEDGHIHPPKPAGRRPLLLPGRRGARPGNQRDALLSVLRWHALFSLQDGWRRGGARRSRAHQRTHRRRSPSLRHRRQVRERTNPILLLHIGHGGVAVGDAERNRGGVVGQGYRAPPWWRPSCRVMALLPGPSRFFRPDDFPNARCSFCRPKLVAESRT
jgi:hypothetical protein